jgi:hypothetical protein
MPSRYDINVKDILTVSQYFNRKTDYFLDYIRALNKFFLINTVFKWIYGGELVYISEKQQKLKKIKMKRSENEFTVILPLKPGLFQYYLTIDCEKKESMNFKKKDIFIKKFKGFKTIKRLDKEMISSDSILNKEIKRFPYFLQISKEKINEVNSSPQLIPAQLLTSFYTKKIFKKNILKFIKFIPKTEATRMVLFNHIVFFENLKPLPNISKIFFSTRIRIKEKTFGFFFFKVKKNEELHKVHPIKLFFKIYSTYKKINKL